MVIHLAFLFISGCYQENEEKVLLLGRVYKSERSEGTFCFVLAGWLGAFELYMYLV